MRILVVSMGPLAVIGTTGLLFHGITTPPMIILLLLGLTGTIVGAMMHD